MTVPGVLREEIPLEVVRNLAVVSDQARTMGIRIAAPPGAGKSRLLGRYISFLDFLRGYPTLLVDPSGQSIDNCVDRIGRLSKKDQELLWPRVVYVDMGATFGLVEPMPLYHKLGDETLYTQSRRFLDVVRRADPDLRRAPLMGWNAVSSIGEIVGMALSALGLQISEADLLLDKPEEFLATLRSLAQEQPDLVPVIGFLNEYKARSKTQRDRETMAFRRVIAPFRLDPKQRALYCTPGTGVDLQTAERNQQLVLFDLRGVESEDARRFAMFWVFRTIREHMFRRGTNPKLPISLVIDELTYLLPSDPREDDMLTEDLVELTSRIARNHKVWLTLAHQDLNQVSPRVQNVLMRMGTQIFGGMSDPDMMEKTARRYVKWDPYMVKKVNPVWMNVQEGFGFRSFSSPRVIDQTTEEFSYDEQVLLFGERLYDLGPLEFEVAIGTQEGRLPRHTRRVNLGAFESGIYPDLAKIEEVRHVLAKRHGLVVSEALALIEARREGVLDSSRILYDAPPPRRTAVR